METLSRYSSRPSQSHSSLKQRSGYEPSDTETESEWREGQQEDINWNCEEDGDSPPRPKTTCDTARNVSPFRAGHRRHSKSPYKAHRNEGSLVSPKRGTSAYRDASPLGVRRHISPFRKESEDNDMNRDDDISSRTYPDKRRNISPLKRRRYLSPNKQGKNNHELQNNDDTGISSKLDPDLPKERNSMERYRHVSAYQGRKAHDLTNGDEHLAEAAKQNYRYQLSPVRDASTLEDKPSYTRRSSSTTKQRLKEDQLSTYGHANKTGGRTPPPSLRNQSRSVVEASHAKTPSVGEINEAVANAKLASPGTFYHTPVFESSESITPGDLFFSRDFPGRLMQKIGLQNGGLENKYSSNTQKVEERNSTSKQSMRISSHHENTNQKNSSTTILSRAPTTISSAVSRQISGLSMRSSKMSDTSMRTTDSVRKFAANRRKVQTEAPWFACMRRGNCRTPKSPESRDLDEASFIAKAFVIKDLRQFWADKHQPLLNVFICHKQEAQILKKLVSQDTCPHLLFKGPTGSGKRALTIAFIRETFRDMSWNITHELRHLTVQEKRQVEVVVPVTSSAHHVELNVNSDPNARHALMALVREISSTHALAPEISTICPKADYKVMVLYEVDKATENIQHLIKWVMDCYSDACKLTLCCEDDVEIIEPVKNRCKVIQETKEVATVLLPSHSFLTIQIMEILIQVATKEDFDLPRSFAAKIAAKSKQNIRKAIMALEACRMNKYPFVDDQPIPVGWEEVLVELSAEILADPSPKRGKFQKLLVDFVSPRLILQKLTEEFLKHAETSLKRELFYWHAYYDKRLPTGTSALLKLEEFVAKFMSIYRKSLSNHQFV